MWELDITKNSVNEISAHCKAQCCDSERSSKIHNMVKSFLQVDTYFDVHIFPRDISSIFKVCNVLLNDFRNQIYEDDIAPLERNL